jgi:hypothetical protein
VNERLNKLLDRWHAGEFETHEDQADMGSTLVDLLNSELCEQTQRASKWEWIALRMSKASAIDLSEYIAEYEAKLAAQLVAKEPKP